MIDSTRPISALRAFLASKAAGAVILMVAAALAMIVANSVLSDRYHDMLHPPVGPALTGKLGPMTVQLWINEVLMAIFFLFVGLEIKRELIDGGLSTWRHLTINRGCVRLSGRLSSKVLGIFLGRRGHFPIQPGFGIKEPRSGRSEECPADRAGR